MSRLPVMRPDAVIKCLLAHGFVFMRGRGSHRLYTKGSFAVTVAYHNKDMRVGTLRSIIRQSGMSIEEFFKK